MGDWFQTDDLHTGISGSDDPNHLTALGQQSTLPKIKSSTLYRIQEQIRAESATI